MAVETADLIVALVRVRALYFMLADAIKRFIYLKVGLAAVLAIRGTKFIGNDLVGKVPVDVSLPIIAMIVDASITASLLAGTSAPEDRA